jgi:hypothetical protein
MLRFGSRFVNAPGVTTTTMMAAKTTTAQLHSFLGTG